MRAGIFSQRTNVWAEQGPSDLSPEERRRRLAEATGGASTRSSHAGKLAELFRPPVEIISHLPFDDARDEAKDQEKWILINIQDESFDSQVLNRDIWKDAEVQQTVKNNFIFLQMNRNGVDGRDYVRLYMPEASSGVVGDDVFPHISIIDPRTGEQVKVWVGMPKTAMELVHTLHEFLARYSLRVDAKNPVQRQVKAKPKVDVERMTEDEMLQLAMENSLNAEASSSSPRGHDPDDLTRGDEADLMEFEPTPASPEVKKDELTPFQKISGTNHHSEPPLGANSTRIQFKLHDGSRVVRRFLLSDRVERLFEYVKADLLPEKMPQKENGEFDLVSMGKRLIDVLDQTVEVAGLKMGTVMVETIDEN